MINIERKKYNVFFPLEAIFFFSYFNNTIFLPQIRNKNFSLYTFSDNEMTTRESALFGKSFKSSFCAKQNYFPTLCKFGI